MKKMIFGLIAIVVAASAVAFTQPKKAALTYFWAYDASGSTIIYPNSIPPTTNPVSCPLPANVNCAAEYPSYTQVQVGSNPTVYEYRPSGTIVNLFLKP